MPTAAEVAQRCIPQTLGKYKTASWRLGVDDETRVPEPAAGS